MATAFKIGDLVKARRGVQGLVTGESLTVEDLDIRSTPFGDFVTYYLRREDDRIIPVGNGHLVLFKLEAE
jgi:hypothetical protein